MLNLAMVRSYLRNLKKKTELQVFLLIEYVTMLVSYVAFCFKEPFLCTMNFRYIPLSFWFPMVETVLWLQKDLEAKNANINKSNIVKGQKTETKTAHPVFRSILICALCVFIALSVLVDLDFVAWSGTSL